MKGDVINNKHPRYYNTTHTTHKCFQRFFTPHRSTRKTLSSTVLSVKQVLQSHRETHRFFAVSAVQLAQQDRGLFHFHRVICSVQLKSRIGLTLTKAEVLRIMFKKDGAPITSKSHTHPSNSQTSRLLTSSLSLGDPVPRTTKCLRGV
jgi:hypothetical protein